MVTIQGDNSAIPNIKKSDNNEITPRIFAKTIIVGIQHDNTAKTNNAITNSDSEEHCLPILTVLIVIPDKFYKVGQTNEASILYRKIVYYIINCKWVCTQWQWYYNTQYNTHTQNSTQHNNTKLQTQCTKANRSNNTNN
jgi:hypothetical protein